MNTIKAEIARSAQTRPQREPHMPQLTHNLFYGSGSGEYYLDITKGEWPKDINGAAYIIAPDKKEPGGHWLGHHGEIYKIGCQTKNGKLPVLVKRVNTPLNRLREKLPKLFGNMSALEFSPFGISNLANTNLQVLDGRMFVGYDLGRPIEVDGNTLEFISPVGSNDEWIQGVPAPLEPQISVAAHPAADYENKELYFVNYKLIPDNNGIKETTISHWDLEGKVRRWPIADMKVFDTIHDIKATRNYLVFSDLPFIVEPMTVYGKPRKHANQEIGQLWIIAKDQLKNTKPGEEIHAQYVKLDLPAGHIKVDINDDDDIITLYLQHIPATDLGLVISPFEKNVQGERFSAELEGFVSMGPQPNATGKYRINAKTGEILESKVLWDKNKHWTSVLWTDNIYSKESREQSKHLWMCCMGYEPDLTLESAKNLYSSASNAFVGFNELPEEAIAPSIFHIDLDTMEYDDEYFFETGTFAHPPTFIPRKNPKSEDDGYVLVFLNKDHPKEIQLFDATNLAQGPVAVASGNGFNPPVTLHSTWSNSINRQSTYKVNWVRDIIGAGIGMPKTALHLFRYGKNMNKRFEVR